MDARELRIGNWILYKGIPCEWSVEDFAEWGKNIELAIEPIPLTEEWLERFGFVIVDDIKKGVYGYTKDSEIFNGLYGISYQGIKEMGYERGCLYLDKVNISGDAGYRVINESHGVGWSPLVCIKYVHQLQNLYFALTGEELNIKHEQTTDY